MQPKQSNIDIQDILTLGETKRVFKSPIKMLKGKHEVYLRVKNHLKLNAGSFANLQWRSVPSSPLNDRHEIPKQSLVDPLKSWVNHEGFTIKAVTRGREKESFKTMNHTSKLEAVGSFDPEIAVLSFSNLDSGIRASQIKTAITLIQRGQGVDKFVSMPKPLTSLAKKMGQQRVAQQAMRNSSPLVAVERTNFEEILEYNQFLKTENKQLTELNKKLVIKCDNLMYKDTLKEAAYIIEGQYNQDLVPQRYKYIFEEKKEYLKAICYQNNKQTKETVEHYQAVLQEVKESYANEVEGLYEMLSDQIKESLALKQRYSNVEQVLREQESKLKISFSQVSALTIRRDTLQSELLEKVTFVNHLNQLLDTQKQKTLVEHAELKQNKQQLIGTIKDMRESLFSYQRKYHDIDISEIHMKMALLTTQLNQLQNEFDFTYKKLEKKREKIIELKETLKLNALKKCHHIHAIEEGVGKNKQTLRKVLMEVTEEEELEIMHTKEFKKVDQRRVSRINFEEKIKMNRQILPQF